MRVHMVRYNLQSNMQQYKLDGLVAGKRLSLQTVYVSYRTCSYLCKASRVMHCLLWIQEAELCDGVEFVAALAQVEGGQEAFFETTLPHVIARASLIGNMLKHDNGAFPIMRKDESRIFEISRVQVRARAAVPREGCGCARHADTGARPGFGNTVQHDAVLAAQQ
jgi:hypothetical protein